MSDRSKGTGAEVFPKYSGFLYVAVRMEASSSGRGSRAVYVSGPLAVTLCMNVAGRGVTVDTDRDDPPVAGQVLKGPLAETNGGSVAA
jgi:hypothetical protein